MATQNGHTPTSAPGGPGPSAPEWTPDPQDEELERTVVRVPVDYAHPDGPQLDLAVSRLCAPDPARRRGVLIAVNGGPGGVDGLGVRFPRTLAARPALRETYDLVGFDPRGYGESTPLHAYVALPKVPFDSRPPDELFPAIAEDMRAREQACARGGGDLRPHVNTRNTVHDIDRIRQALGEEKISFLGYAFGTVVGAAFGTLFPHRLDRSVLDSCVHPEWTWRELFLKQAEAIRANVEAWAGWTAERDGHFGLGRSAASVLDTVESLAAQVAAGGQGVRLRTLLDGAVGNDAADRGRWAALADLLRTLREALDRADAAGAAELLAGTSTWRPGDQEGDLRSGVLEATTLETYWPQDLETYYADMRTFRERYPYGYGVLRAQPWVGAFRSYQPPQPPVVAQPGGYPAGLVIQAEGDPLDNYEGGVGMAERLGHRLVTVADSGEHEVYVLSGNPVVDELADRYFAEGVLPDGDVSVPGRSARPDIPADPPAAVAPAVKSTTAPVSAAEAFGYFTEAPLEWWPERHKLVSGERVAMVFEPRAGGRWYEVAADGTEARWGTVLEWEPARRIVLTWRIGGDWRPLPDDAGASEIEVGFAPAGDGAGTVVTVAHTRLERYGAAAAGMRAALQAPGPGGTLDAYAAGLQRHLADRAVRV